MKFTLTIELGNAAMLTADDVARSLRDEAKHIANDARAHKGKLDKLQGFIRDANGNTVGEWGFDEASAPVRRGPKHNHFGEIFVLDTCPGCKWLQDNKEE